MTDPAPCQAIILSVGDELTTGQCVDTNSAFLSRALATCGIGVLAHETVGDRQADLVQAVRMAADRAEVVLITGGLGPTPDDITRQALAEAMGAELKMDETSLARIEAYFRRLGRDITPNNRIQAMIPVGAEALANSRGTAPGIAARLGRAQVFVMPGVPHEMEAMFEQSVRPRLPSGRGVILYRTIRLYGAGESAFAAALDNLLTRQGPVVVGTTVAAGLVSIRIISHARDAETAERQAQNVIEQVRQRLEPNVVGVGDDATMESAVGDLLRRAGQTLATAESCTGGQIGQMLTDVPGSSQYYLGGIVCYSNEAKQSQLGVPADLLNQYGAVSEPVARAMAEGVRRRLKSDWAIGVTGIAGPTGGSAEKPVGLVYTSLAGPEGTEVNRHMLSGDRRLVRLRASLTALNELRLRLLNAR